MTGCSRCHSRLPPPADSRPDPFQLSGRGGGPRLRRWAGPGGLDPLDPAAPTPLVSPTARRRSGGLGLSLVLRVELAVLGYAGVTAAEVRQSKRTRPPGQPWRPLNWGEQVLGKFCSTEAMNGVPAEPSIRPGLDGTSALPYGRGTRSSSGRLRDQRLTP
jgi:hypothetical protein